MSPPSASSFEHLPALPVGVHLPGGHGFDPSMTESSPTIGYQLNHFMLRIRDPKPTLHFYIDLMGMRTVFAMNTGPMTVYYLGFPQTEEHRADPAKFAHDTMQSPITLTTTLGLLELCHFHGSEDTPADGDDRTGYQISSGNTPPHLGFGHLGFTVPDVPAAVERLRREGVTVVKELGVSERESIPISDWETETLGVAKGGLHSDYKWILDQIAFVQDPNGYLVELVPQNMK